MGGAASTPTWTYYSTSIVSTATLGTTTVDYPQPFYVQQTVTNSAATTTTFSSTTYGKTVTSTKTGTFTSTVPLPAIATVSASAPANFTPILSESPYTQSVLVQNLTTTATEYNYTSFNGVTTSTLTPYTVLGALVSTTVTTSIPTTTLTVFANPVTRTVLAAATTSTQNAACASGSSNFVDHFPFGLAFGARFEAIDGSLHHIDPASPPTAFTNSTPANQYDCCNLCMANPLCAAGYFSPVSLFGDANECQLYLVASAATCDASKTAYTLLKGTGDYAGQNGQATNRGYFAFNGRCGQIVPDQHEYPYYELGQPAVGSKRRSLLERLAGRKI